MQNLLEIQPYCTHLSFIPKNHHRLPISTVNPLAVPRARSAGCLRQLRERAPYRPLRASGNRLRFSYLH